MSRADGMTAVELHTEAAGALQTGVWALEDNLFWMRNGDKQWLRGFGFHRETYVRGEDGRWRFSYRKLEPTHAETSPGATVAAAELSGENLLVGIG